MMISFCLLQMKRIDDEVATESTDDVTVDFNDEVAAEAIVDNTADFDDKVEYSQGKSPEDNDPTKMALEVLTCIWHQ